MIVSDKHWLCNAVDHSGLFYFVLGLLLCRRFKKIKKLKNLKIMTNMQRGGSWRSAARLLAACCLGRSAVSNRQCFEKGDG